MQNGAPMSTIKYFDGNLGFYGYDQLADYTVNSRSATTTVLDWNPTFGALDPTHFAAHVTLSYSGYSSYVVEDGPDAGQTRVTGGTLTEVAYTDAAGNMLLDISNLSVRLPVFLSTLARGDSFSAWKMVVQSGATITGSNSAAGPGHAATGDVIDTTSGNDTVMALGGDDFVKDRGGADSYAGGAGFDTLSYDGWNFTPWAVTGGIWVDQLLGTVRGPDGVTDKISGFEDISGTFLNDTMKGNSAANQFEGGAGNDTIDGRGGQDTVSYARDAEWGGTDGIRVNLATGLVRDGFGTTDKLLNIEGIVGTATRDTFFDNGADNSFDGGAGNDTMHFSGGNDFGHGGAGADTFLFDGNFSDDTIDDFDTTQGDKIRISGVTAFNQISLTDIATDDGPAVLVTYGFGFNTVTLLGHTVTDLHAADFGF
jgi:Ca2+-binding RTX toxin-like protein